MSGTPSAGPSGVLVVDKPLGPTSMDVCRVVKRALIAGGAPRGVKVGHGGTLDPLATGVVVVLVGACTRMCERVMAGAKAYLADVDLSAFTTTDDAEGVRTEVAVASPPGAKEVAEAASTFVGEILQRPPNFSAIKIDGRTAYSLARAGEDHSALLEERLKPRPVRIDAITVMSYEWPRVLLSVDCGKGVYIRSLARDLGVRLGTGGTLAGLRRTRVGPFVVQGATAMDAIRGPLTQSDLRAPPE